MDIQLPGINGVDALQQLRADPITSSTPVIGA
jgi:CheY-like chemotaxis protein